MIGIMANASSSVVAGFRLFVHRSAHPTISTFFQKVT
jgi:hypothetical protein